MNRIKRINLTVIHVLNERGPKMQALFKVFYNVYDYLSVFKTLKAYSFAGSSAIALLNKSFALV